MGVQITGQKQFGVEIGDTSSLTREEGESSQEKIKKRQYMLCIWKAELGGDQSTVTVSGKEGDEPENPTECFVLTLKFLISGAETY